jgi:hypothetical protein
MGVAYPLNDLNEGINPTFAAEFAKIRRDFVLGLSRREAELEQAASDAARDAVLHRLAGAAGGYGFEELSRLAREAMELPYGREQEAQQQAFARLKLALQAARNAA